MQSEPMNLLLAEDDEDDCIFFKEAFEDIKIKTTLRIVNDGVELMNYLTQNGIQLPQILFLDLNLPLKTGIECLLEIKRIPHLKDVPIVIYSTSSSEKDIEDTFVFGANVYVKKPNNFDDLKKILKQVIAINWLYQTTNLSRDSYLFRL
jgi:CheY-like chemotaxis protein